MKTTIYYLIILFSSAIYSQEQFTYKRKATNKQANYYDIVAENTEILKTLDLKKRSNLKAAKQFGRWKFFWRNKINNDGSFPIENYPILKNLVQNQSLNQIESTHNRSSRSNTWTQVGPQQVVDPHGYVQYPGQGMVEVVRLIPNSNGALAGASNGGIWKTDDITVASPVWSPKTDAIARIGISDIRHAGGSTWYAVTGDRDAADRCRSIGVIKSTDNGNTWATTALNLDPTQVLRVSKLGVHPTDRNKAVFCARYSSFVKIYRTDNGFITVNEVENNNLQGLNDIFYTNNAVFVSTIFGKIFKSLNNGETWELIYDNNEGAQNIVLRFNEHAVDNNIYFLAAKKNGAKVYRASISSFESASSSNQLTPSSIGASLTSYEPQGVYNVALAVNPSNNNEIFVFGVNGWYSTNAGTTWTNRLDAYTSSSSGETYAHPDWHFSEYIQDDTVLASHDGGVAILTSTAVDNGTGKINHQDKTGNLQIGQIYNAAIYNNDSQADNIILGLQDNDGMSKSPNTKNGNWVAVYEGDGTAAAMDYNDPKIRYVGFIYGGLSRTSTAFQGGHQDYTDVISIDNTYQARFDGKAVVSNTNSNLVFATHVKLKYSTNRGVSFSDEPSSNGFNVGVPQEIETHNNRIAVIGTFDQKIGTINSSLSFPVENITTINKPTGVTAFFNSISLSSPNNSTVYATISGYSPTNKVFKSTDNGVSWTNITGNLPNVVMQKVVAKATNLGDSDEILFVATENGVYYKTGANSTSWSRLGDGMPNVTVTDLDINYTADKLYAATFGRGIFEIDINPTTLGIDNPNTSKFENVNLFPNPTINSQTFVTLPDGVQNASYKIYNYLGGLLKTGTVSINNNNINVQSLTNGLYLITFKINNAVITKKLTVR